MLPDFFLPQTSRASRVPRVFPTRSGSEGWIALRIPEPRIQQAVNDSFNGSGVAHTLASAVGRRSEGFGFCGTFD